MVPFHKKMSLGMSMAANFTSQVFETKRRLGGQGGESFLNDASKIGEGVILLMLLFVLFLVKFVEHVD